MLPARLRRRDQGIEGQGHRRDLLGLRNGLELQGSDVELLEQPIQKIWVLRDSWLLEAPMPAARLPGKGPVCGCWSHGLEAGQAMGQQSQVMAFQLGKLGGVDACDRLPAQGPFGLIHVNQPG